MLVAGIDGACSDCVICSLWERGDAGCPRGIESTTEPESIEDGTEESSEEVDIFFDTSAASANTLEGDVGDCFGGGQGLLSLGAVDVGPANC